MTTAPVSVEISPGELIDKITILAIKSERLSDPGQLKNVHTELALLEASRDQSIPGSDSLNDLTASLKSVNQVLWDIEDDIRGVRTPPRIWRQIYQACTGGVSEQRPTCGN